MAARSMDRVVQDLRQAALRRGDADRTDGQLLECFVRRHDAAALAALIERHAPMVWGVCRRILPSDHDAEDALQAAFLVLVRRAAAVVPRALVANWLYGVARQTALKARATAAKRCRRERQVQTMPEPSARPPHDLWSDLEPVLDEELGRLPRNYRAAIVLCGLEGKSRSEAARHLGCPEGTLAAWLARGRALLARRLARRGLIVSSGTLAAVLAQQTATAAAPAALVSVTIGAATAVAAGQTAASVTSTKAAALAEGVLKTMFLTKLAHVLAIVLVLGILGAVGGLAMQTPAANAPNEGPALPDGAGQRTANTPNEPLQGGPAAAGAKDTVPVRARLSGEIVSVMDALQVGKVVKKGEVLAVLASKPLALKQLDFIDTQKQSRQHQAKLQALAKLYEEGAVSAAEYRAAEQDARALAAALDRAGKTLIIWGLTQDDLKALSADAGKAEDLGRFAIRAPVDGTVVERLCNPGEWVEEKTVLARLQPAADRQPATKTIKIGANLDAVDADNAMVTLTVGRKIVGKDGHIVSSQLTNIWVAKDANIRIGDKAAKLADLRPKCGVWVRMGERADGFQIVEIEVMQKKTH